MLTFGSGIGSGFSALWMNRSSDQPARAEFLPSGSTGVAVLGLRVAV